MSPPVSSVAKSDQMPVFVLIEKLPAFLSPRVGLIATHSTPLRWPAGSQPRTRLSIERIEAALTAAISM